MRIFTLFLAMALSASAAFGFDPRSASLEEKVVFLNTDRNVGTPDPVKVNRVRFLLDKLQQRHGMARGEIVDLVVKAQGVMKDRGISESLTDIMESTSKAKIAAGASFNDVATGYAMLRVNGGSRDEAVKELPALLKSRAKKR